MGGIDWYQPATGTFDQFKAGIRCCERVAAGTGQLIQLQRSLFLPGGDMGCDRGLKCKRIMDGIGLLDITEALQQQCIVVTQLAGVLCVAICYALASGRDWL